MCVCGFAAPPTCPYFLPALAPSIFCTLSFFGEVRKVPYNHQEREREREKIKYQSLAGIPSARSAIVLTLLGRVVKSFAESEKCLPSSGVWSAQVLEYFWTTETFPAPATIDRDNNKNCACSRKTAVGAATISGTLLCGLVSLESSVPFSGRCGLHPHTQPAGPGCLFETFAPFQHG